ncbi:hypothetical protein EXIGLDRAFT_741803 [Exidia glandulosa HHB12029]|uniref:Ribophorin II C-terminal domain-containing protein n=1 Tax=Exidia glandulosa HHB12029 TaxID=1314781 RepID=A0A165DP00_EXIGL|nr:hypothetical protein EXIGLDRAFT_741803 [Exidia glandulosa HHB12029]
MKALLFAPLLALARLADASTLSIAAICPSRRRVTEPARSTTRRLSLARPIPPLNLTSKDTLRLTFTVFVKAEGGQAENVVPHQTFLRFYDPATNEEGIQPIRVKSGGKAKIDLNMSKPPASLPPTPNGGPLQVSLILGSFKYQSASYKLFELYVPRTQPATVHPDEASFHPLPAIHHTFRADPKSPPRVISLVFAAAVLAPWVVLLGLLSRVPHSLPHLFSPQIAPFVALLAAFEGLLFTYWVKLRLPDVLLYGAILAVPTVATGKRALGAMVQWRLGEKA